MMDSAGIGAATNGYGFGIGDMALHLRRQTKCADRGRCGICGSSCEPLHVLAHRGGEVTWLWACQHCGCEFLQPQPSVEWLNEEYHGYSTKRKSAVPSARVHYFKILLGDMGIDFSGRQVLDIGAAEGDCVQALNSLWPSAIVSAIEPNRENLRTDSKLQCLWKNENLEDWLDRDVQETFDLVLLFDVLEHLRNPVQTFQILIVRHLNPGGTVIATFPNAASRTRKLLGFLWPQYKVEHLHYFTPLAVDFLKASAGLDTLMLQPLKKKLPLSYFLSVGSAFGPIPIRLATQLAKKLIPSSMASLEIKAGFGELLWVARRPS